MRGSGKTPGLPFAKRSVQQAVRVFFRWERIFVFMLKPWEARAAPWQSRPQVPENALPPESDTTPAGFPGYSCGPSSQNKSFSVTPSTRQIATQSLTVGL